jgi:hypothetical protein
MSYMCYNSSVSSRQLSLRLPLPIEKALEAYRNSFTVTPSKSAVITKALEDFLLKEGYLEPGEESGRELPLRSSRS